MIIRKEHLNLLRKIAWSFYNTTGLDWQELFSEAALAYCEGVQNLKTHYDSSKGQISIYLWNCVKSHLLNYIKKQHKYSSPLCHSLDTIEYPITESYSFEYSPIYFHQKRSPTQAIKKVLQNEKNTRSLLQEKYGWSDFVIEQVITDMKISTIQNEK